MITQKFNLITVIILMAACVTGIIVLQFIWLKNTAVIKEEHFSSQVEEALNQTVENIESLESLIIFKRIKDSEASDIFNDSVFNSFSGTNNISSDPFYAERIKRRNEKIHKMMTRLYWEYSSGEAEDLKKAIYPLLDSVIKNSLSRYGISLPFEYAVVSAGSDIPEVSSKGFSAENETVIYRTALFPNSVIPSPQTLIISFNGKYMHIFRSMLFMLAGTVLLTVILVLTIAVSIRTLIRQKKIAEIKSDFINNMTHEFKTPIATISLASDAIESPMIKEDETRIKYYTGIIREENRRMNRQVENILQMSQLDKNELEMNLTVMNIIPLIHRVADIFRLHVNERNGTLSIQTGTESAESFVDENHFCNLISNLLDNAVKYSQGPPEITISTRIEKGRVFISVADKGMGISRDAQKMIFEKFYREHTGYVHNVKGFGLGLTYAKAVTEALKGSIEVKSKPGIGSTFTIKLPLAT